MDPTPGGWEMKPANSKSGRKSRRKVIGLLVVSVALTLGVTAVPQGAASPPDDEVSSKARVFASRGDIRHLPRPLKSRLIQLFERPRTFEPTTAFSEADKPSQLFQYYLLDTNNFQPNVFTSKITGINDQAIQTGANAANGGRPTIGSVRVTLEPKPGLPTDPDDPRAFIDMFTDISGLFVINNE